MQDESRLRQKLQPRVQRTADNLSSLAAFSNSALMEPSAAFSAEPPTAASPLQRRYVQARLEVGAANDHFEQEADRVADAVVQRKSISPASITGLTQVQRSGEGAFTAPDSFSQGLESRKGKGEALPSNLQESMGARMGADFSGVRIHRDTAADTLSRSISAKAFTHGSDVFFKSGAWSPDSSSGQHLIAHELTHTLQQGAVQRKFEDTPVQRALDADVEKKIKRRIFWFNQHKAVLKILREQIMLGKTLNEIKESFGKSEMSESTLQFFNGLEKDHFGSHPMEVYAVAQAIPENTRFELIKNIAAGALELNSCLHILYLMQGMSSKNLELLSDLTLQNGWPFYRFNEIIDQEYRDALAGVQDFNAFQSSYAILASAHKDTKLPFETDPIVEKVIKYTKAGGKYRKLTVKDLIDVYEKLNALPVKEREAFLTRYPSVLDALNSSLPFEFKDSDSFGLAKGIDLEAKDNLQVCLELLKDVRAWHAEEGQTRVTNDGVLLYILQIAIQAGMQLEANQNIPWSVLTEDQIRLVGLLGYGPGGFTPLENSNELGDEETQADYADWRLSSQSKTAWGLRFWQHHRRHRKLHPDRHGKDENDISSRWRLLVGDVRNLPLAVVDNMMGGYGRYSKNRRPPKKEGQSRKERRSDYKKTNKETRTYRGQTMGMRFTEDSFISLDVSDTEPVITVTSHKIGMEGAHYLMKDMTFRMSTTAANGVTIKLKWVPTTEEEATIAPSTNLTLDNLNIQDLRLVMNDMTLGLESLNLSDVVLNMNQAFVYAGATGEFQIPSYDTAYLLFGVMALVQNAIYVLTNATMTTLLRVMPDLDPLGEYSSGLRNNLIQSLGSTQTGDEKGFQMGLSFSSLDIDNLVDLKRGYIDHIRLGKGSVSMGTQSPQRQEMVLKKYQDMLAQVEKMISERKGIATQEETELKQLYTEFLAAFSDMGLEDEDRQKEIILLQAQYQKSWEKSGAALPGLKQTVEELKNASPIDRQKVLEASRAFRLEQLREKTYFEFLQALRLLNTVAFSLELKPGNQYGNTIPGLEITGMNISGTKASQMKADELGFTSWMTIPGTESEDAREKVLLESLAGLGSGTHFPGAETERYDLKVKGLVVSDDLVFSGDSMLQKQLELGELSGSVDFLSESIWQVTIDNLSQLDILSLPLGLTPLEGIDVQQAGLLATNVQARVTLYWDEAKLLGVHDKKGVYSKPPEYEIRTVVLDYLKIGLLAGKDIKYVSEDESLQFFIEGVSTLQDVTLENAWMEKVLNPVSKKEELTLTHLGGASAKNVDLNSLMLKTQEILVHLYQFHSGFLSVGGVETMGGIWDIEAFAVENTHGNFYAGANDGSWEAQGLLELKNLSGSFTGNILKANIDLPSVTLDTLKYISSEASFVLPEGGEAQLKGVTGSIEVELRTEAEMKALNDKLKEMNEALKEQKKPLIEGEFGRIRGVTISEMRVSKLLFNGMNLYMNAQKEGLTPDLADKKKTRFIGFPVGYTGSISDIHFTNFKRIQIDTLKNEPTEKDYESGHVSKFSEEMSKNFMTGNITYGNQEHNSGIEVQGQKGQSLTYDDPSGLQVDLRKLISREGLIEFSKIDIDPQKNEIQGQKYSFTLKELFGDASVNKPFDGGGKLSTSVSLTGNLVKASWSENGILEIEDLDIPSIKVPELSYLSPEMDIVVAKGSKPVTELKGLKLKMKAIFDYENGKVGSLREIQINELRASELIGAGINVKMRDTEAGSSIELNIPSGFPVSLKNIVCSGFNLKNAAGPNEEAVWKQKGLITAGMLDVKQLDFLRKDAASVLQLTTNLTAESLSYEATEDGTKTITLSNLQGNLPKEGSYISTDKEGKTSAMYFSQLNKMFSLFSAGSLKFTIKPDGKMEITVFNAIIEGLNLEVSEDLRIEFSGILNGDTKLFEGDADFGNGMKPAWILDRADEILITHLVLDTAYMPQTDENDTERKIAQWNRFPDPYSFVDPMPEEPAFDDFEQVPNVVIDPVPSDALSRQQMNLPVLTREMMADMDALRRAREEMAQMQPLLDSLDTVDGSFRLSLFGVDITRTITDGEVDVSGLLDELRTEVVAFIRSQDEALWGADMVNLAQVADILINEGSVAAGAAAGGAIGALVGGPIGYVVGAIIGGIAVSAYAHYKTPDIAENILKGIAEGRGFEEVALAVDFALANALRFTHVDFHGEDFIGLKVMGLDDHYELDESNPLVSEAIPICPSDGFDAIRGRIRLSRLLYGQMLGSAISSNRLIATEAELLAAQQSLPFLRMEYEEFTRFLNEEVSRAVNNGFGFDTLTLAAKSWPGPYFGRMAQDQLRFELELDDFELTSMERYINSLGIGNLSFNDALNDNLGIGLDESSATQFNIRRLETPAFLYKTPDAGMMIDAGKIRYNTEDNPLMNYLQVNRRPEGLEVLGSGIKMDSLKIFMKKE